MSSFRRQERPAQPTYLKRKGSFLTSCQLPGGRWLSVPPLPGSLSVSPSWDFLPGVREPCFLLSYSLITRHLSAPLTYVTLGGQRWDRHRRVTLETIVMTQSRSPLPFCGVAGRVSLEMAPRPWLLRLRACGRPPQASCPGSSGLVLR